MAEKTVWKNIDDAPLDTLFRGVKYFGQVIKGGDVARRILIDEDDLHEMMKEAFHCGYCKKQRTDSLEAIYDKFKYEITISDNEIVSVPKKQ